MYLDLSSLRKAHKALTKSLAFLSSEMAADNDLREQFRAAAIQAFEVTHELAFKMVKRQLEQILPDPSSVDKMPYMDVIRSGAEAGLITEVARFRDYREKRNITSHTYDSEKAEDILAMLPAFCGDIGRLIDELEQRNRETD